MNQILQLFTSDLFLKSIDVCEHLDAGLHESQAGSIEGRLTKLEDANSHPEQVLIQLGVLQET